MNSIVIVLGTDHYNTLWLIRSLGIIGIKPFVIVFSCFNKSFVVKSKYCSDFVILDNKNSIISYLLNRKVLEKNVILTSSDDLTILLDENYDKLRDKYIYQNCNQKQGNLSFWMNKREMLVKADECGLSIPKSYSFFLDEDSDLSQVEFPCLIKPKLSAEASKDNFRICSNLQDLKVAIDDIKMTCSNILVQEYIDCEYEYLIYGVSTIDGEICLPGGVKKIHTCNSINNLGMMSYGCLSTDIPKQLVDYNKIKKFIRAIGYKGLFSVEFMISRDKAYFLEINLRNDGTCYMTTQAGVNMPSIWVYSCLNLDSSNLSRIFLRPYTYGMNEINYLKYSLKITHLYKCIKEICSVKAFSLLKFNDMLPVFYKVLFCIYKIILNKFR